MITFIFVKVISSPFSPSLEKFLGNFTGNTIQVCTQIHFTVMFDVAGDTGNPNFGPGSKWFFVDREFPQRLNGT